MKYTHVALLLGIALMHHIAHAKEEETKLYPLQSFLPVRVSGYVKHESFADSRQVVGFQDDQVLLYPEKKLLDSYCQDINARGQFDMVAIQTRLRLEADGPKIGGAKSCATIEADFYGKAGISNIVRMRHAFLKLAWEKVSVLGGQYWHPLYVPRADPRTLSFNGGMPMETFSRNPQLRITYKLGSHVDFIFAASSELDSPSDGPIGSSTTYMRDAVVPMLDGQIQGHYHEHLFGAGIDFKRIIPRLQTNTGVKAHESLNSISAIAYAALYWEKVSTINKVMFLQNPTDLNTTGGYAVHCVDAVDDHRNYTNLNAIAWWNDTEINYHKSFVPGWFIGFIKNLGSHTTILQNVTDSNGTITDQRIFGTGTDIDYVFRISPRLKWKAQNFMFGAEIEYTRAAFGTIANDGDVINTTPVGNVRLLLTLFYYL